LLNLCLLQAKCWIPITRHFRSQKTGDCLQSFKDVMPGDAKTFLYVAYRGLWAHARELGGIV